MKKISRRNFLLASGVVTIGAALTACGGSSSTSTAASSTASSAAASEAPAAGGKTLNIWCWNDEFQSRFNDYYPEVAEIAADKSSPYLCVFPHEIFGQLNCGGRLNACSARIMHPSSRRFSLTSSFTARE